MTSRAEKLRATNIAKYGSLEAWKAELARNGSIGGRARVPKGFMPGDPRVKAAGAKGGKNGKPPVKHFVMVDGERTPVADHARETGVNYNTLLQRLKREGRLV